MEHGRQLLTGSAAVQSCSFNDMIAFVAKHEVDEVAVAGTL
jgi:hypothetical protein